MVDKNRVMNLLIEKMATIAFKIDEHTDVSDDYNNSVSVRTMAAALYLVSQTKFPEGEEEMTILEKVLAKIKAGGEGTDELIKSLSRSFCPHAFGGTKCQQFADCVDCIRTWLDEEEEE